MKRNSIRAVVAAAATVLAIGGLSSSGSPAQAGVGISVDVEIRVLAPNANAVLEDLTVELWKIDVDPEVLVPLNISDCTDPIGVGGDLADRAFVNCSAPTFGDYALGLDGVPTGATVMAECSTDTGTNSNERIPGTGAEFTLSEPGDRGDCIVFVVQPALLVDKIVPAGQGTADQDDFTIEIFDDAGEPVTTAIDPSPALCGEGNPLTNCAVVPLPAGSYQLGEVTANGYVPSNVWCDTFVPEEPLQPREIFPEGIGTFEIGDAPQGPLPFAECQITNRYYEGELVVRKVVVNDDGGTASASDFTAEVFPAAGGALVEDGLCDASGDCIDVTLPIGEYRIGETGPAGYAPTVACSVTREPDGPGPITTDAPTTTMPPLTEAITGDAALAEVEPFGEVTCVITNNDIATTTTTTTTIAPTTTDVGGQPVTPTTLAPVLPATGPNESNTVLIVLALGLLTIGGSLMALRRR